MTDYLKGKKTYIIAAVSIVYGIIGWAAGWVTSETAQQIIQTALIGAGLRAAR